VPTPLAPDPESFRDRCGLGVQPRQPNHAWQNLWGTIFLKTRKFLWGTIFLKTLPYPFPFLDPPTPRTPLRLPKKCISGKPTSCSVSLCDFQEAGGEYGVTPAAPKWPGATPGQTGSRG